jgi:predicted MPP superfamily phosphohydrolase
LADERVIDLPAQALANMRLYGLSYAETSRQSGIPESTLKTAANRLKRAEGYQKPINSPKPHIIGPRAVVSSPEHDVAHREENQNKHQGSFHSVTSFSAKEYVQDRVHTVVAIGDHHDKPGRDKTRALWISRFIANSNPDAIVSIGDWASFDSLSTHETPGSGKDADRPAFHQEIESLDESLSLLTREFGPGALPFFHTHGNHEYRAERAADRQPKLNGDMTVRRDEVFLRYGCRLSPFGQFLDLYGVDFVHVPLSIMGREMGGENVERNVANKTTKSCVFGHTHRANFLNISKIGQSRALQVLNLGTSLPYGCVERYARMSQTGWTYGIFLLRILDGQILSAKHYDMLELEERYAD